MRHAFEISISFDCGDKAKMQRATCYCNVQRRMHINWKTIYERATYGRSEEKASNGISIIEYYRSPSFYVAFCNGYRFWRISTIKGISLWLSYLAPECCKLYPVERFLYL